MNLLQLQQANKSFGTKVLFEKASFSINEGEHVGVIGPNGAGKTTLFKILVGQESLDSGDLVKSQKLRLGYLEQEAEWSLEISAQEYLAENCSLPLWKLESLGKGLGLAQTHFKNPLRVLSGGYRMRMKLLYLIGREPNLMLLDEPTNFLDLESVLALEKFLQDTPCSFLLISHDREFLRRTTESTLEVEAGDITKFPGHIDDYFEQKSQLREILQSQAANLENKRKHIQDFVDRFRAKATKAKQAQSRLKQLEKMQKIELKDLPVRAKIHIPAPLHTGKESLRLENADLGYFEHEEIKKILSQVHLRLERGIHLGVVGYNGAGKSTLLKTLAGRLPLLSGQCLLGYQVSVSYFAQHLAEELSINDTILEALQAVAHQDIKVQEILNLAGSLLFSGDDVYKPISVLSGGEKARVALGRVLLQRSPLLLLDEPTNHLDFDTVEALTESLRSYPGTVIVVSHDRSFISRIATQILEIRDGTASIYPGSYDDYVWSLEKGALSKIESTSASEVLPSSFESLDHNKLDKINYKDESKRLQGLIRESQRKIKNLENQLQTLTEQRDQLTQNLLQAQGEKARELAKQLSQCSQTHEQVESSLLEEMEASEENEKSLTLLRGASDS